MERTPGSHWYFVVKGGRDGVTKQSYDEGDSPW